MPDAFFYEAFEEEAVALRRLLPAAVAAEFTGLTIQETEHAAPPAKFISIRNQSRIPLDWADKLDAILTRSTGYDHLTAYAAACGLACPPPAFGYLPLYCHRAVAEQAMLLWMALLRRLPRQMRQFHEFHRDGLTGAECQGRTLVVVGVGNIGHEVCAIGRALGMRVVGVDVDPRHADVDYASIDNALAEADVIVCAMDLNPTSVGYFDSAKWRRVKPGAVFVNVSRGEISPSAALLSALESGQLGGVGLDVYDHEPALAHALRAASGGGFNCDTKVAASPNPAARGLAQAAIQSDDPEVLAAIALSHRDDAICTPHNAFNSQEAVERKSLHSVQQLIAFRDSREFLWPAPPRR
jgi:D-lactate dehydrogenase